jgi:hypothetical protein
MGDAAYSGPVTSWVPNAGLADHSGAAIGPDCDLFASPPSEIGEVLSAHTSLQRDKQPVSTATRVAIGAGVAIAVIALFEWFSRLAGTDTEPELTLRLIGVALATMGVIIVWAMTRFRHECSFIGRSGLARFHLHGSRMATVRGDVFLFRNAAHLRTREVRHYTNGIYTGTNYDYSWTDANGLARLKLSGSYQSKKSTPKASSPYYLATAAELAWSYHLLDGVDAMLGKHGYVEFPLLRGNWVRVGQGYVELKSGTHQERLETSAIKTFTIANGTFKIKDADARLFSQKGKFSFEYAHIANARLFLLCLDTLAGLKIS